MKSISCLSVLCLCLSCFGLIINPAITTDKSVNATSVKTIVADLIKPGMSDEEKLLALFNYHRRVMHHFRLQQATEDPSQNAGFDLIRLYTVYGSAWCTQQAAVFSTLCAEVFGRENVEGTAGNGTLATLGTSGGHSSFHVRYNSTDKWHWIDPIIGAYARNKTDGSLASFQEIVADPSILIDAEKEGRASIPFFPCTKGSNFIPSTLASAYSYFDYDTAFIADFASAWTTNAYTTFPAYFTTKKVLQKGEQYLFLWDFLPGDYFNLQDKEKGLRRDWEWYPPRHLCGWKDSLDRVNWPYFKPYQKVIKGDTCYRYYANGIHTFEPDMASDDPSDAPYLKSNIADHTSDSSLHQLQPQPTDSIGKIAWRIKLPYPLMSLRLLCHYTRTTAADSFAVYLKRLTFNIGSLPDQNIETYPNYRDTLTPDNSWRLIRSCPVSESGTLDTTLRTFIDPASTSKTYQGYLVMVVMKGSAALSGLKVESIFQHNMFALPQLVPGENLVTISVDSGTLTDENLTVAFSWKDGDSIRTDIRSIRQTGETYTLKVNQTEMPKMLSMAIGNTRDTAFGHSIGTEKTSAALTPVLALSAWPNPSSSKVRFHLNGTRIKEGEFVHGQLSIFSASGKLVKKLSFDSPGKLPEWNAGSYPPGLYLAKLESGQGCLTTKIVLLK